MKIQKFLNSLLKTNKNEFLKKKLFDYQVILFKKKEIFIVINKFEFKSLT
jgi:hypothetical protein